MPELLHLCKAKKKLTMNIENGLHLFNSGQLDISIFIVFLLNGES
jgi:hypothetical protein